MKRFQQQVTLKGLRCLAEGVIEEVLERDVPENREEFGVDSTFDLVRFRFTKVHHGLTDTTVDAVIFTGVGGHRLLEVKPGPAVACLYGRYNIPSRPGRVLVSELVNPSVHEVPDLLARILMAA